MVSAPTSPTESGACVQRNRRTGIRQCESARQIPQRKGLKGPLGLPHQGSYGISSKRRWRRDGLLHTALQYSKERIQFGKPIGGFQLQQKKLG